MKKPDIETADRKELVEYIEWASRVIEGSSKLQIQLALLCDILADDIAMVCKGGATLKVLTGEAKLFEQLLAVVKNKADFAALTLINITEETTTTVKKKRTNVQDFTLPPKK